MYGTIRISGKTEGHASTLEGLGYTVNPNWQVKDKKASKAKGEDVFAPAIAIQGTFVSKGLKVEIQSVAHLAQICEAMAARKTLLRYSTRFVFPDGKTRFGFQLANLLQNHKALREQLGWDASALIAVVNG